MGDVLIVGTAVTVVEESRAFGRLFALRRPLTSTCYPNLMLEAMVSYMQKVYKNSGFPPSEPYKTFFVVSNTMAWHGSHTIKKNVIARRHTAYDDPRRFHCLKAGLQTCTY
jgi:hypothetical protein